MITKEELVGISNFQNLFHMMKHFMSILVIVYENMILEKEETFKFS
jgi:hypothetical protein